MTEKKLEVREDEIEINLFGYLIVILKSKEFIIKTTLAAMVLAAVNSLFIPPTYLAETKILPPQSGNSSMSSLMASQMAGMGLSALGGKTTSDLYIALLKTRGVTDFVTDKLDLMNSYKLKSRTKMRGALVAGLTVRNDSKSGLITIGFENRKPQLAADIANAFVEGLQNFNNSLAVTEAGQRRLFFEEQLKAAKENLIKSEENLKAFQQRTGTIKIDEEAKAVIVTVADMRAKVSAKEVQLRVMKSYATTQNPDLQRLQDETLALKEELLKMESKNRPGDDSVPTVGKMSSLGTEYIRRMREYRYSEALYEILIKQFEAAKLDESKDAALLQIVERAEAPEGRIKPQRRSMVVRTGMLFCFLSILFVLLKSFYNSFMTDPLNKTAIHSVKECLNFNKLKRDFKLDLIAAKLSTFLKKR